MAADTDERDTVRSRHTSAGRLGALAVVASMALPAAAMGDDPLFGTFDGRFGNVVSQDHSATAGSSADAVDRYDSRAADDFEVPAGTTWHVRFVGAGGRFLRNAKVQDSYHASVSTSDQLSGAADAPVAVRVTVHADAAGRPGAVLRTDRNGQSCGTVRSWSRWSALTGEQRICGGWHGMLATRFPTPLTLGPGRYWVSFQVEADPRVQGEWFWGTARFTDWQCSAWSQWGCYARAHWQNPGGGYGTTCTLQWRPVSECVASHRAPRCAAAVGTAVVPTPACEERRPFRSGYGEDLELLVMGAASTTSPKR